MAAVDSSETHVLLLSSAIEARGSCAYTLRLARKLPERGIAATLVTPNAALVEPALRSRLDVHEYRRLDSPVFGAYVARCLVRDLAEQPVQLVHAQSPATLRLGQWLAHRLNCPCVVTLHAVPAPRERLRIDARVCRRMIAGADVIREALERTRRFPGNLLATIVSGVDVASGQNRASPLDPGHVPIVGAAGPLESLGGLPYLFGAARLVLAQRPEVEFLVAGAGPEEANLRRIARELSIAQKVTFVPYGLDFSTALGAMDIFCLPTLHPGAGAILLEAMALGRPVIAAGTNGASGAVRDGQTGLIVPPEHAGELARRILELLDDPVRARALGTAARELVQRDFDVDRMVSKTAELYREVCSCPLKSSPSAPS